MITGWGKFSKVLQDDIIKAYENHYGLNPEHPGQFFDIETQTWINIPTEFSPLCDLPK